MVWYSPPTKNIPQFVVIHRVKGFEAEVDFFFKKNLFLGKYIYYINNK